MVTLFACSVNPPFARTPRRRWLPLALTATLLMSLRAAAPCAAESDPAAHTDNPPQDRGPAVREAVIPPGQEEALAKLLGRGAELPGGCEFAHAQVNQSVIDTNYKCPAGSVAIELHHPSQAPSGATETSKFALVVREGEPPQEFIQGLLALIRAEEGSVSWEWTSPTPVRSAPGGYRRIVTLGVILAVIVGVWALRRSGRRSTGD